MFTIVSHFFLFVNPPKAFGEFLFGCSPFELAGNQDSIAAALKAGLHDKLTGLMA